MPGASFSIVFLQDLHGFSKRQSEMTTFNGYLATDNHTVNHNVFRMSSLQNLSQWNRLDKKNYRANIMEMKFPIVTRKIKKIS